MTFVWGAIAVVAGFVLWFLAGWALSVTAIKMIDCYREWRDERQRRR